MDAFPDDHARHHRPPRPRAAPKPKPKRICVSRSVATAGLVGAALAGLMVGGASGVVFSPDQAGSSPALDEAAIRRIAGEIVDQAILVYHIHDHGLEEASPSPSSSSPLSPTPFPTATAASAGPKPTQASGPSSTRRPSMPSRTASPAPTAAPSLCLRPGKPSVGQDPCKWPHN